MIGCLLYTSSVDIFLFRKLALKSKIITASHPWFKTYKRRTRDGPDAKAWKSMTDQFHIRSSVRESDAGLFNQIGRAHV